MPMPMQPANPQFYPPNANQGVPLQPMNQVGGYAAQALFSTNRFLVSGNSGDNERVSAGFFSNKFNTFYVYNSPGFEPNGQALLRGYEKATFCKSAPGGGYILSESIVLHPHTEQPFFKMSKRTRSACSSRPFMEVFFIENGANQKMGHIEYQPACCQYRFQIFDERGSLLMTLTAKSNDNSNCGRDRKFTVYHGEEGVGESREQILRRVSTECCDRSHRAILGDYSIGVDTGAKGAGFRERALFLGFVILMESMEKQQRNNTRGGGHH